MRKASTVPYYLKSAVTILRHIRPLPSALAVLAQPRGHGRAEPKTLELAGVRMQARAPHELWSLKETFLDDFYGRHGCAVQPGWSLIDIGSATGEFTVQALKRGAKVVVCVDPSAPSLELLRTNLRANELDGEQVVVRHAAAVAKERQMRLREGEAGVWSLTTGATTAGEGDANAVPGVRLDALLEDLPGRHCDLIKLDCEGAEFEVLLETSDEVFDNIDRVVLEYHPVPGYHVDDIAHRLRNLGYRAIVEESPVHRGLGYIYATKAELT